MQNGQLVEAGKHTELVKSDGYYAKLYNIQAQGFSDVDSDWEPI